MLKSKSSGVTIGVESDHIAIFSLEFSFFIKKTISSSSFIAKHRFRLSFSEIILTQSFFMFCKKYLAFFESDDNIFTSNFDFFINSKVSMQNLKLVTIFIQSI